MAGQFEVDPPQSNSRYWRAICLALALAGTIIALTYRSSPFRTLTRDFQIACYDAGNRLRAHNISRIVSLGSGPFPEHGVGWEAGYKAAYFGGSRVVGSLDVLPDAMRDSSSNLTPTNLLLVDIEKASPEAILVWGESR
jgi:hypothetical protein